jgi:hypothetical protein
MGPEATGRIGNILGASPAPAPWQFDTGEKHREFFFRSSVNLPTGERYFRQKRTGKMNF